MADGGVSVGLGLALALGSTCAWSGLDVVRKRLAGELGPATILLGFTAAQVPIHVSATALTGFPDVGPTFLPWTALAAALTLTANILFVRAVRVSPLSLTVPYLSFSPVLTLLFGVIVVDQVPGPWGVVGVVSVAGGALLLNAGDEGWLRGVLREPGSRLMLGVAACFSLSSTIDRVAILQSSESLYAATLTAMIAGVLVCMPSVRREIRTGGNAMPLLAFGALLTAAAMLLQFVSYRHLFVAYVDAVKRAGGNILAVVSGLVFFGEGHFARRLLAAGLMSAGVALVLLG